MPKEFISFNGVRTFIEYENLEKVSELDWEKNKDVSNKMPFIIQHGHGANHFFVKPIFDYFAKKGWPVVMFDWRGHGWSQKDFAAGTQNYTLDNCVTDLYAVYSEFLLKRYGYKKFNLLGHSMGGFIALKYAILHQDTIHKFIPLATTARIVSNFILKLGMKFMINKYRNDFEHSFGKKKKHHEELGIEFFPQWKDSTLMPERVAVYEFMEDMLRYDIRDQLSKINLPTYAIVGSKDSLKGMTRYIANHIKGARFELMQGYVHNIPVHARDTLPPKIEKFLLDS